MAKKPPILCNLEKNKFVGGQRHFVDTFNWLVSFCSNFKFDKSTGMKLDMSDSEKPVVTIDGGKAKSGGDEVVVEVKYDRETHTLTQYKRKLAKSVKFADDGPKASTVFVATPIST